MIDAIAFNTRTMLQPYKRYYYCGTEPQDLKSKLLFLGIGREEPQ
ncbi:MULTISPECIES: hypothetical protein [Nostocales]|uniref:Uncharacterized protein n=2 Tax=Nostocales TaxID=1161 RepID=A0ABW8WJV9_9CYAN|nr:hypothetical protein [Tolypothrix bouteillei]